MIKQIGNKAYGLGNFPNSILSISGELESYTKIEIFCGGKPIVFYICAPLSICSSMINLSREKELLELEWLDEKPRDDTKEAIHKQDHTMFDGKAFGISTEEIIRKRDMIAKIDWSNFGGLLTRLESLRIASTLPNKSVAELLENAEKVERWVKNQTI